MNRLTRIIAITTLFFGAYAIHAQTAIDFTQQLVNARDIPITEPGADNKPEPVLLWQVAINALEAPQQSNMSLPGVKKFEMDQLARKIFVNKSKCALTPDELKTVKDAIGESYQPIIVGAAWRLLEPGAAASAPAK